MHCGKARRQSGQFWVPLDPIAAGSKVLVTGLVKAVEFNGQLGTVLRWTSDKSRCIVTLDGGPKSMKPANVRVCGDFTDSSSA